MILKLLKNKRYLFQRNIESLLVNVELEEYQKKLVVTKWVYNVNYMDKQARKNAIYYYVLQIIIIFCGTLIPVLTNIKGYDELSCIITVLGLTIAISASISQLFKFEKKWYHYRIIAEKLRLEGFAFIGLSEGYNNTLNHKSSFSKFSKSIDQLLSLDINQYQDLIFQSQELKEEKG